MKEKLIELLESTASKEEVAAYGEVYVSTSRVADHLIANGVTIQKWIPVGERLPETNGYHVWVIACIDGSRSGVRLFERKRVKGKTVERFKYPWETISYENITHWMPLPSTEGLK